MNGEDDVKIKSIAFNLIETEKHNNVAPQAWLTWELDQIADHKITRLDEPMPWRYAARGASKAEPNQRQSAFDELSHSQ